MNLADIKYSYWTVCSRTTLTIGHFCLSMMDMLHCLRPEDYGTQNLQMHG